MIKKTLKEICKDNTYMLDEPEMEDIINFIEKHTNLRVIDELESIKSTLKTKSFSEHCIEEVDNRIKELKQ